MILELQRLNLWAAELAISKLIFQLSCESTGERFFPSPQGDDRDGMGVLMEGGPGILQASSKFEPWATRGRTLRQAIRGNPVPQALELTTHKRQLCETPPTSPPPPPVSRTAIHRARHNPCQVHQISQLASVLFLVLHNS